MIITREMLETIDGVQIEDWSRDADEYVEALQTAIEEWLHWLKTVRRSLQVSDSEMSSLCGDGGLPRDDAWRTLLLDEGVIALCNGWAPPGDQWAGYPPQEIAYSYCGASKSISYQDLSELVQNWELAMTPVLRDEKSVATATKPKG